jgi:hypothetical protein
VEVFILASVCEEIEKKRKKENKRIWMNNTFVSRCDEGNFIDYILKDCAKVP